MSGGMRIDGLMGVWTFLLLGKWTTVSAGTLIDGHTDIHAVGEMDKGERWNADGWTFGHSRHQGNGLR